MSSEGSKDAVEDERDLERRYHSSGTQKRKYLEEEGLRGGSGGREVENGRVWRGGRRDGFERGGRDLGEWEKGLRSRGETKRGAP